MFRNRGENPIDIDGGDGFNVNFYPVYYIVYDKSLPNRKSKPIAINRKKGFIATTN